MREQHRLWIRWHTWLPTHRCIQQNRIDVQQDQIPASAEEPVRRQMHLLGRRQVDEPSDAVRIGRRGVDRPMIAGARPLIDRTQMHQHVRSQAHDPSPYVLPKKGYYVREKRHTR
jgi:hypothetical protein